MFGFKSGKYRKGYRNQGKRGIGQHSRAGISSCVLVFFVMAGLLGISACGKEEEPLKVELYYENVCASCEGDADFFALYNKCISSEEKKELNVEIATYNVFMESCKERYEKEVQRLGIPQGTYLPVLVIGDEWFEGYEAMEASLHRILVEERAAK